MIRKRKERDMSGRLKHQQRSHRNKNYIPVNMFFANAQRAAQAKLAREKAKINLEEQSTEVI